MTTNTNNK